MGKRHRVFHLFVVSECSDQKFVCDNLENQSESHFFQSHFLKFSQEPKAPMIDVLRLSITPPHIRQKGPQDNLKGNTTLVLCVRFDVQRTHERPHEKLTFFEKKTLYFSGESKSKRREECSSLSYKWRHGWCRALCFY
jgi:hypothetical protein